ncbi:MAG: hypothetical protein PHY02_09120 [Phycisphaerae bacterium]|nr:hypothetical protein [Phycisphaerae bacterium]
MMSRLDIPDNLLKATDPSAVRTFLLNSGFELSGINNDVAEAYSIKDGGIVILPLKKETHEYTKLLLSLVEYIGHIMKLSFDDVLGLIASPNSDIMRYKIHTEDSKLGHLRADEIRSATSGIYNILINSAKKIANIRKRPNIRESAHNYADGCKFGQTEYGSFVLKVFCPTSDLGLKTEYAEPYCREVTRGVVENFRFLAYNDVSDPEVILPPTMSKDVARSITEMLPLNPLMFSAGIAVRYSPLKDPTSTLANQFTKTEDESIDFKSNLFEKAEILFQRYRKAEEFERETLIGFITDLHKDPPVKKDPLEKEISHRITMELKFGTTHRKVTTILMAPDYRSAIKWHDEGIEIILDAIIDKRTKKWGVHEMFDLRPRDPQSENKLF